MTTVFRTARLILRPLVESDLPAYQRLVTQPEIAKPAGATAHPSTMEVAQWLQADRRNPYSRGIVDKQSNQLIGVIVFYDCVTAEGQPDPLAVDLGYLLAPTYWGAGLMTEALRALLAGLPGGIQVWATSLVENRRSRRVLEKLGFQTLDEHFMAISGMSLTPVPQALYRLVTTDSTN